MTAPPLASRCQTFVYGGFSARLRHCSRPAVVNGYCRQHDPEARKAKDAERRRKREQADALDELEHRREQAADAVLTEVWKRPWWRPAPRPDAMSFICVGCGHVRGVFPAPKIKTSHATFCDFRKLDAKLDALLRLNDTEIP